MPKTTAVHTNYTVGNKEGERKEDGKEGEKEHGT